MKAITENTKINLTVLSALLGGVLYVSYTAFQGNANADAIKELQAGQKVVNDLSSDVKVIREKVENIERELGRRGH